MDAFKYLKIFHSGLSSTIEKKIQNACNRKYKRIEDNKESNNFNLEVTLMKT